MKGKPRRGGDTPRPGGRFGEASGQSIFTGHDDSRKSDQEYGLRCTSCLTIRPMLPGAMTCTGCALAARREVRP